MYASKALAALVAVALEPVLGLVEAPLTNSSNTFRAGTVTYFVSRSLKSSVKTFTSKSSGFTCMARRSATHAFISGLVTLPSRSAAIRPRVFC